MCPHEDGNNNNNNSNNNDNVLLGLLLLLIVGKGKRISVEEGYLITQWLPSHPHLLSRLL